jgi:hypothetical protein
LKLIVKKNGSSLGPAKKFHSVLVDVTAAAPYLEITATLPEAALVLIVLDVPVVPGHMVRRIHLIILFNCLDKSSTLSPVLSMLISIITFSLNAAAVAFGLTTLEC